MTLFQVIILAILQGITEFIPVSSSGHLVVIPKFLNWPSPPLIFDIAVHFGTLIAVCLFLKKEIKEIISKERKLIELLIIATIPAGIIGWFFGSEIEKFFSSPGWVAYFWIIGALFMLISEKAKTRKWLNEIKISDSFLIGIAQAAAIFPGISRSGVTIAAGRLLKIKRPAAAIFSFLMLIPVILGTLIWQANKLNSLSIDWLSLFIGFLISAISGYLALKFLLIYLKKGTLNIFAYYCIFLALITLILS